jgi:hypothetical protein
MKKLLLMTIGATALLAAAPAQARLQISITANGATFSCFDGELTCDNSGGANNLLVVDQFVGGAFVQIALAQSALDNLQLSSSNIRNLTGSPLTVSLFASDTNFAPPVARIENSASLTFNNAIGSGVSTLSFFADPANAQGANPVNTPGTLLASVAGAPTTDPDSFSGTRSTGFSAFAPFSMTETASLNLVGEANITGFNQSMEAVVPEPRTWVMLLAGFAMLGYVAHRKGRRSGISSGFVTP